MTKKLLIKKKLDKLVLQKIFALIKLIKLIILLIVVTKKNQTNLICKKFKMYVIISCYNKYIVLGNNKGKKIQINKRKECKL